MPTSYSDQFFIIDPYNPPPLGTPMTFSIFTLTDQNDDLDFDRFNGDSVDGSDITSSWPGDTVTVNVPGVGNVTYTGVTFYLADGRQVFTPNDGQVLQNGTLAGASAVTSQGPLLVSELGPACFTPGTLIETDRGERLIENLQEFDLVMTRDHGLQPIVWIGRRSERAEGDLAPVRIEAGALGNDRALTVSPEHRLLIEDWRAPYVCGHSEVLVAAKHLVNGTTVRRETGGIVDYIHLLFAQHEVIWSNGIPSESYYPEHALTRAGRATRDELLDLFPELGDGPDQSLRTARPVCLRREAEMIAAWA